MKHLIPLLCCLACNPLLADPIDSAFCPPAWSDSLIYYQSFDAPSALPEINTAKLHLRDTLPAAPAGFHRSGGLPSGNHKALHLAADTLALSPHKPLTIAFWWSLKDELPENGGFNLVQLNGRGWISHFARGGPWCALKDTASVVQIYNLPNINNVNGIYDTSFRQNLSLKKGQWHHTALVLSAASLVSVYTDGRLVFESRTAGRPFSPDDNFKSLTLGGQILLDEVLILNRPLTADDIAEYVTAFRQIRQAYAR